MKEKILSLLINNKNDFISGQKISNDLDVSRAAIWKYINRIKEDGYEIESVTKKGYRLISSPDILTYSEINKYLKTEYIGKKIIHFNTIDSTNRKAKELAAIGEDEGTVIISEEQTKGRGRLGRDWISPKYKGIWMSLILRPDINPIHASKLTIIGAAAVVMALHELGRDSYIKWPNDIILNDKKVCGILTEMNAELDKINYIILGIGINVNIDEEDFPEQLRDIATSLKNEFGMLVDRKNLIAKILNNFEFLYEDFIKDGSIKKSIEISNNNSILIGKEIKIISGKDTTVAKALSIDEDGALIVEYLDGTISKIISGEVSVRGLRGYI